MDIWGVTPPEEPYFDDRRNAWNFSRYADVCDALREPLLAPTAARSMTSAAPVDSAVHADFRSRALQAVAGLPLSQWAELADQIHPAGDAVDLLSDYAIPWCRQVACLAAGVSMSDGEPCALLALDIFLSAGEPFDTALQQASHTATAKLAALLSPIPMQMFVALSQSLPAFLGSAWLALLQNKPQLNDFDNHAMEELLRFAGPSRTLFRQARIGVTVAGCTIEANQLVILHLDRANRDSAQFPDPNQLQLRRSPCGHLAFGAGGHACVAGGLIRAAAWTATTPILDRLRTSEVLAADRVDSSGLSYWKSLKVGRALPTTRNPP